LRLSGAWAATQDEPTSLEFVAVAQSEAAEVMSRLAMTAYYHAGPTENRLGAGHVVPIGEGWVDGSPLDHMLVRLPYLWGPQLEHCPVSGRHVQVLWLIPIYRIENDFRRLRGQEALEQRFEERSLDYLNPFRPPVLSPDDLGDDSCET